MSISISRYYPLFIGLGLIGFTGFIYLRNLGKRYRFATLLRMLTILFLVLSLCGVQVIHEAQDITTVFIADVSKSVESQKEAMESFIIEASRSRSERDLIGVLAFAQEAKVEKLPDKSFSFDGLGVRLNQEFTNIQTALISGNSIIESGTKRRLVLLTDGYENVGDARKQLASFAGGDTVVDIVDFSTLDFSEVQFDELVLPEKVERNQTVEIQASISSNIKTSGVLYIYSNNQVKYEKVIDISVGENLYVFSDTITDSGLVTYGAQIIVDEDTYTENNFVSAYTMVNDLPKILVVEGEEEAALNFKGMLESSAILESVMAEEVPQSLEELLRYDGYLIANVPIDRLSEDFLLHMEEAVRLQGRGLLVTGGETSFGPGGYYKTILEDILPLNMDAKPKEEKPNLALMLVIDKSGSMGGGDFGVSQMELAKEAAIRSLEVLEAEDYIGVLGFDSLPKWVVEPVLSEDKAAIENEIARLAPGGGTSIQPSLKLAIEELEKLDAGLKHIILLTDGQAEQTGYLPLLERMNTQGMTLSTVAVGSGADKNLLQLLAEYGNGRYYATDVFTDIPSIFTKEAFMAGKKYLNNVTFFPKVTADSPIIAGIDALPQLDGYVATEAKDKAKVILEGPEEDPILASWQYGLGRTVAFTSDMKGLWSSKWLSWSGNQGFWINTMSWLVQQDINTNYGVSGYYENGRGIIDVTSLVKDKDYSSIEGLISSPDGITSDISLEAVSPGSYRGEFEPSGQGIYLVTFELGQGEESDQVITALNIGYSKEYDFLSGKGVKPQEMAAITGGRLIENPEDVLKGQVPDVKGSRDLTNWLLSIAFLLFMTEIVLRKVRPPVKEMAMKVSEVKDKMKIIKKKDLQGDGPDHEYLNTLLTNKKKNKR